MIFPLGENSDYRIRYCAWEEEFQVSSLFSPLSILHFVGNAQKYHNRPKEYLF